jgi:N-acylneuraminate cytidylyltransferase
MYKGKKIIAIIPARIGSKRIKEKNLVDFNGKPLIKKTIDISKKCRYIDQIVVSTDSKKILKIAKKFGVKTPFLRSAAFDDKSSVNQATLIAIKQSEEHYGKFDVVVQLMPNCPLRKLQTLNNCIKSFFKKKIKSQISFFEYGFANPRWAHQIKNFKISPLFKKNMLKRSQDMPKLFCPSGSIWISDIKTLKKYKTFYSPSYGYFLMSFGEAIDIDTHEDLKIAKKFQ